MTTKVEADMKSTKDKKHHKDPQPQQLPSPIIEVVSRKKAIILSYWTSGNIYKVTVKNSYNYTEYWTIYLSEGVVYLWFRNKKHGINIAKKRVWNLRKARLCKKED